MDDLLAAIVTDALEQAVELIELDAVRAEVWASDLAALAAETGPNGVARLIDALVDAGGAPAAAALWAIDALVVGVDLAGPALGPAPPWADDLLTSTCEGAWLLRERRGVSAAFRFVDNADNRHVVIADLVPTPTGDGVETIGEVAVGPTDLLDGLDEPEAGIADEAVSAPELAQRVARAVRCTDQPSSSCVATGRLLLARLSSFGIDDLEPPVWVEPEAPAPPEPDPGADEWARQVLDRALGELPEPDPVAVAKAAATLRAAAGDHAPLARWLAASVGPVDLDEPDLTVVTAALAATAAPADLAPLDGAARAAVVELEWADWLGVAIGLARAGEGESTDPDDLVDHINRCPEVTSTIPKADRARVSWALAVCTEPWEPLGIAAAGRLTEFGAAVVPAGLRVAWGVRPDR